ncbi:MAG: hypothetical protein IJ716_09610 [Lachnospiraceae bacterium]|nr:hypothetical protein [Lachnospiraceae bacterium]
MQRVAIYGAGKYGQITMRYLKKINENICFFIVSDNKNTKKYIEGIPVKMISEISNHIGDCIIYVAMDCQYWESVKKSLNYYLPQYNNEIIYINNDDILKFERELNVADPRRFLERIDPVSRVFGLDRGMPIDRYYIEKFLEENIKSLNGVNKTLEVGEIYYTDKYFENAEKDILDFQKGMDLTVDGSIPSDMYDCFVCTQTFNFIYDVRKAIKGAYNLLKSGGVLLATVAGNISQVSQYDMDRWGDYWRFTYRSAEMMMQDVFGEGNVQVKAFGNAMAATAFVQGIAVEEVDKALLDIEDPAYAIIIGIFARK